MDGNFVSIEALNEKKGKPSAQECWNVLVEEFRMNAEEMFEVFMLANGNAWAKLVKANPVGQHEDFKHFLRVHSNLFHQNIFSTPETKNSVRRLLKN